MSALLGQDDAELLASGVVELDPFEVTAEAKGRPDVIFELESPRLAYYDVKTLPNGELIVALDFIDRYRASQVPGDRKWAALVYFPWIDGRDVPHRQWLCLYAWGDVTYGFSPDAAYDDERRFAVYLPFEERRDPARLLAIAEAYLERVAPAREESYYLVTETDEEGIFDEDLEFFEIPAGRLAPILDSERGKSHEELILMPYEYLEDPNPLPINRGEMGPVPPDPNQNFRWSEVFQLSPNPHPFDRARALLMPRWSQRAEIIYEKDILFFKDLRRKARILLFNVGNKIYAYHPKYGVWQTKATLQMLQTGQGSNLITYPGGVTPKQVFILPWDEKVE